jgi:hypothetical protein
MLRGIRVRTCVGIALLLSAALMSSAAWGGAWTLPQGAGQMVVTDTASQASRAFDSSGKLQSVPRYTKEELQVLMEYGVTDWLTAIVSPGLQYVNIAAPVGARRAGIGYTELGGRARVLQGANWVLSGQTTVRVPGTYDAGNPAAIGYTGVEVDVRGLFGIGFGAFGMPAFVDIQLAQRFRTGGPPDEARVDLTFGLRTARQWLVLAQSFNVISEGSGSALFPAYNYHKLQLSGIYEIDRQWALQAGLFTTVAGRSALQENGLVLGAWYRY